MPCLDGSMYSRGIVPPTILSTNSKPAPFSSGSSLMHDVAVLAPAARLADEPAVALGGATDRLAVRDLRLADVGGDLELAHHAVDEHVEVQLAHAGDERLAALGSVLTRNVGSSSARRWRAMPSLSWSALVLGSIATSMTGSGNVIDLEHDRVVRVAQRVAGEGVLEADDGGDVARVDLVDLLAVVGVHLEDAADALLLALGRVEHVGAGLERAGVDPEERELADERIGGDLEGEGAESGSLSSTVRTSSCVGPGLRPIVGGTSSGDGRYSMTASSIGWTPLFFRAEPVRTGHELRLERAEPQAVADLGGRQLLALEVLVGQVVVRLGDASIIFSRHAARPPPGATRGSRRRRSSCRGRPGTGWPSSR